MVTAASVWSQAHVAICPHGAGCTNMVFMPPNSSIFEIIADGQKGRVYQGLAASLGHRYVKCLYNITVARARSQLGFARNSPYSSFVLDVPWLLDRIRKSGTLKKLALPARPPLDRKAKPTRGLALPARPPLDRKAKPTRGLALPARPTRKASSLGVQGTPPKHKGAEEGVQVAQQAVSWYDYLWYHVLI